MKKFLLPSILTIFMFSLSCSTSENDDVNPRLPNDPLESKPTNSVNVILPEGVNLDLSKSKLYSNDIETSLSQSGESKVLNLDGNPAFAYVFDVNNNLVLAGLISSSRREISAETTAEFLLYYGFGLPFREEEFALKFFDQVRQFPIWKEWYKTVEDQLKADPLMLSKPGIVTKMSAMINPLLVESKRDSPNARKLADEKRASDLFIDGEEKSGLQAYQTGLNEFKIDNFSRRRVHGFLYKTSFVDQSDKIETKYTSVGSSATATPDKEISIPMVNGITGISTTVYEYLIGETEKSFRNTSETISIPLTPAEKEANWELRIIGVGLESTAGGKTQAEISKRVKLQMTTLTLDFIVPLIADGIAVKGLVSKGKDGPKGEEFLWEAMITAVAGYVDKMPEIKGKVDKGEYSEAVRDFFTIGWNQFGSIFLEDLAKIASETIYNSIPNNIARPNLETMKSSASRKIKIIGAIESIMKGSDYVRKIYDIQNSKDLESWKIKAKEIEVNLEPTQATVEVNTEKKLTAYIKSTIADGQIIEYHWSTEGKYGKLTDKVGHDGKTFTSSTNEVNYVCTAEADLTNPDRQDVVKVEIFMRIGQDKYKIGEDKAILKVGNKEVFKVGWEKKIVFTERMDGNQTVYSISNGGFSAIIPEKAGAKFYDLVNIRENGSRTTTIRKSPSDLKNQEGKLEYWVKIGGLFIFETYSKEKLQQKITEIDKQLDSAKPNYGSLEVTVIR